MTKPLSNEATLERTQIEVGSANGYRWAAAYYILPPDGGKIYPPMQHREAQQFCKEKGWTIAKIK